MQIPHQCLIALLFLASFSLTCGRTFNSESSRSRVELLKGTTWKLQEYFKEGESIFPAVDVRVRINEDSRFIIYIGDKTVGGINWQLTEDDRRIVFTTEKLSPASAEIIEIGDKRLVLRENEYGPVIVCADWYESILIRE